MVTALLIGIILVITFGLTWFVIRVTDDILVSLTWVAWSWTMSAAVLLIRSLI